MKLSLSPDWYEFLAALVDARVRFLVIGGHAVAVHGEPRFTKDLDVFVEPTIANGKRLRRALVAFGLGEIAPRPAELARPGPFWIFGRPPVRIDVLTAVKGISFARAWEGRVEAALDHRRVISVLGRRELLASKRAAGRPQDLADIANVTAFAEQSPRTRPPVKRPVARRRG